MIKPELNNYQPVNKDCSGAAHEEGRSGLAVMGEVPPAGGGGFGAESFVWSFCHCSPAL